MDNDKIKALINNHLFIRCQGCSCGARTRVRWVSVRAYNGYVAALPPSAPRHVPSDPSPCVAARNGQRRSIPHLFLVFLVFLVNKDIGALLLYIKEIKVLGRGIARNIGANLLAQLAFGRA